MGTTQAPPPGYSPASLHGNHGYGYDQPMDMQYGGYPMAYPHGHGPFVNSSTSNNVVVTQVGGATGPIYQTLPHDYTTQAWLACLCCFWPTGLLAILKASEARDALARGDLYGAQSASNQARTMVRISYVVGVISVVVAVVILAVWFGVFINGINNTD
ncbi:proline-rich transmembrane protein 1-like isoform X2 [Dreissena polymorpha]|nr:proline-rich transmembrane protein 1-like isoform X2 [Dreissena polymorpha]